MLTTLPVTHYQKWRLSRKPRAASPRSRVCYVLFLPWFGIHRFACVSADVPATTTTATADDALSSVDENACGPWPRQILVSHIPAPLLWGSLVAEPLALSGETLFLIVQPAVGSSPNNDNDTPLLLRVRVLPWGSPNVPGDGSVCPVPLLPMDHASHPAHRWALSFLLERWPTLVPLLTHGEGQCPIPSSCPPPQCPVCLFVSLAIIH